MNSSDIQAANRRAAWIWGSLIVGLLGLQVIGGVFAIVLATGDESVAVVPDYHQKALHWDDEMTLRRQSAQLGWQCHVESIPASNDSVTSGLIATLVDDQGQTIPIQQGKLSWYRHARASEVRELSIPAGRMTTMRLDDCFTANGLWEVTVDVTDLDGNRFVHTVTLKIAGLSATPEAT